MRKTVLIAAVAVLAVAMLGSMGCRRVRLADAPKPGRSVSTETTAVALGTAEMLDATVRMGVGELKLYADEPSSTTALDGTFEYAPTSWKPEVAYSIEGTRGVLSVEQPKDTEGAHLGKAVNNWLLGLAPDVPTNLKLVLGVGESSVDLRRVDVGIVSVVTGIGEAKIDLSGARAHDVTAHIEAGVGEVTISVPKSVGVRIVGATSGLGSLDADGFSSDGSDLVNAAWSESGPALKLFITRGVGDVNVVSVD